LLPLTRLEHEVLLLVEVLYVKRGETRAFEDGAQDKTR
jgi:hypothetical protein